MSVTVTSGLERRLGLVILVGGLVAVHSVPGPLVGQEVELRWDFRPGHEHLYEMTQVTETNTPNGPVTQTQTQRLRHTVLERYADDSARLRVTTDHVTVVAETPMGTQEFDSADPDAGSQELAVLGGLVGMSFEMVMGADGRVREVSGLAEMVEEMVQELSRDQPEGAGQMRQIMEGMFGEESVQSTMQQGTQMLPSEPVTPGAEWDFSHTQPVGFGTVESESRFTLLDVVEEDGTAWAHIGVEGSIGGFQPDPDNPMAEMIEISGGDVEGESRFDLGRGVLTWSEVTSTIRMNAMGQSISTHTTVEMELVEIVEP